MKQDYEKYYDLECYLIAEVSPKFAATGVISPFDFYAILVWKASRAKGKQQARLSEIGGSFKKAVNKISAALHNAANGKDRLIILMREWKFRLATATAILTVLYPNEFSVYDIRVSKELDEFLNSDRFCKLANRAYTERLWTDYQDFLQELCRWTPRKLSLREKDKYLWGRSLYRAFEKSLSSE